MAANPNWARWIFASVADYLKAVAVAHDIPALVEGVDDRSDGFMRASDHVEIRITGPFTREISRAYHEVLLDANVLLSSRMDGAAKNRLTIQTMAGLFQEAMSRQIPIFKCGSEPGDDPDALVACLSPRWGRNDSVRVFHFGQINATARLRQSVVDARYCTYLDE
jgi:hypothetical protein